MADMPARPGKTFIGPRLRQLRRERGQTQAEMAHHLGLSPSYINLLENNQRSVSVQVLLRLAECYGMDWRDLAEDAAPALLAELRQVLHDPVFGEDRPDLQELRAAVDHCPNMARSLIALHKSFRTLTERVLALGAQHDGSEEVPEYRPAGGVLSDSPETVVHDLFRDSRNHFDALERAAERYVGDTPVPADELYGYLKFRLRDELGIDVVPVRVDELPGALRVYDEAGRRILLSDGLDHPNKVFQLTHVAGLLRHAAEIDAEIERAAVTDPRARSRCRVELANYFAAAVLMPYRPFLSEAEASGYDIDRLAARFGVSFEQACQRLTTLQRPGEEGVPFFFLRIDLAGNVSKRFNATRFHLAEYGGACPLWDIHRCFRLPGRVLPQFVEMPDGSRYLTINRTVDRPALDRNSQDRHLAVTLGCSIAHAPRIAYASSFHQDDPALFTPIGINCRLCPRQHCTQRAHQPVHLDLPIDVRRRGGTRFES